jgi:hypothetical protein
VAPLARAVAVTVPPAPGPQACPERRPARSGGASGGAAGDASDAHPDPEAGLSHVSQLSANTAPSPERFASRAAVEAAARLVPVGHDRPPHGAQRGRGAEVGRGAWLEITPGSLRLRYGPPAGHRPALDADSDPGTDPADDDDRNGAPARHVTLWSQRSRTRMIRTLAGLDWTPVIADAAGWAPAMITLTYPGDWATVAPDGRTIKRHLGNFRRAWERDLTRPLAAVWKLEFQRRGAPHYHLYAACPLSDITVRRGRGRASRPVTMRFKHWLSATWARIVGAQGDERARHEAAGTGIDWATGYRYTDPKRLAIYFAKHNTKASGAKEYQHRPPAAWLDHTTGVGRWWGTWHLHKIAVEVPISHHDAIQLRRLLRAWHRSTQAGRPRPVRVRRTKRATGQIYYRTAHRRPAIKSLHQGGGTRGGFVLANDAPALIARLSAGAVASVGCGPSSAAGSAHRTLG